MVFLHEHIRGCSVVVGRWGLRHWEKVGRCRTVLYQVITNEWHLCKIENICYHFYSSCIWMDSDTSTLQQVVSDWLTLSIYYYYAMWCHCLSWGFLVHTSLERSTEQCERQVTLARAALYLLTVCHSQLIEAKTVTLSAGAHFSNTSFLELLLWRSFWDLVSVSLDLTGRLWDFVNILWQPMCQLQWCLFADHIWDRKRLFIYGILDT